MSWSRLHAAKRDRAAPGSAGVSQTRLFAQLAPGADFGALAGTMRDPFERFEHPVAASYPATEQGKA